MEEINTNIIYCYYGLCRDQRNMLEDKLRDKFKDIEIYNSRILISLYCIKVNVILIKEEPILTEDEAIKYQNLITFRSFDSKKSTVDFLPIMKFLRDKKETYEEYNSFLKTIKEFPIAKSAFDRLIKKYSISLDLPLDISNIVKEYYY